VSATHPLALARARRLVTEYGIDSPAAVDLEAIAFDLGLVVIDAPLQGASARLIRKGNRGIIRVSSSIDIEGQRRFCIAHEMGHFLLHAKKDHLPQCRGEDMLMWRQTSVLEPEANTFASELIMPEDMFRSVASKRALSLTGVEALADAFRATITATAYRYVELAVAVCALVVSQDGKVKWFLAARDFDYSIRRPGSTLDGRSCAASFFASMKATKVEEDVAADAWLDDERVEGVWTIRELMLPMPRFRSALSVLWIVPGSGPDGG